MPARRHHTQLHASRLPACLFSPTSDGMHHVLCARLLSCLAFKPQSLFPCHPKEHSCAFPCWQPATAATRVSVHMTLNVSCLLCNLREGLAAWPEAGAGRHAMPCATHTHASGRGARRLPACAPLHACIHDPWVAQGPGVRAGWLTPCDPPTERASCRLLATRSRSIAAGRVLWVRVNSPAPAPARQCWPRALHAFINICTATEAAYMLHWMACSIVLTRIYRNFTPGQA